MENQPILLGDPSRSSEREVNIVRRFLRGAWDQDPDLITNFFPIDTHIRKIYREVAADLRYRDRWLGIPAKEPKSASKLYVPLQFLLNDILRCFGFYEDTRRFLNTSKTLVYPNLNYPTWPPLLLAGSGQHFVCATPPRPLPDYALGISPLEVRLESQDEIAARDRLATNMQQLFIRQYNRRYAFGVVISQQTLTVHMFDRSGAVSSPSLDFHAHPIQFCAIIHGLASMQAARLGLDTTMYADTQVRIRTREVVGTRKPKDESYALIANLYYAPDFVGRGTICFVACKEEAPETKFVIKDAWIAVEDLDGRESEASLLRHAQSCGILKGVAQVRHFEDVQIKGPTGRLGVDSVIRNRRLHGNHSVVERVHTRIVISPYGKPLDRFSNRRELLVAFHDAVQAHRTLHDVAGILHRDIKPGNILINPSGLEGDRGVLVDFDHAIRTNDTSPYSTKRRIGTYLFMSRNALRGEEPQTCLDDLESFYYVLVSIVLTFPEPRTPKENIDPLLDSWRRPMAHVAKNGDFFSDFDRPISAWFGAPVRKLVHQLHSIFKAHRIQCASAEFAKEPLPLLDPVRVYGEFLSHIRQAIEDLDLEESRVLSPANTIGTASNPRKRKVGNSNEEETEKHSLVYSWMHVSGPQGDEDIGIPVTAAASRPRRSTANYGITKIARNRRARKTS